MWCVTDAVDPSWAAVPAADSRKRGEGCCLSPRPHLLADSGRTLWRRETQANGTEIWCHLNRQCYRWNTADEARSMRENNNNNDDDVKTVSSCTRSRNHPARKSVIILDLYLWGCRAEGPLVPYRGAKVRSLSVGDHSAWCRHTSVTRCHIHAFTHG